MTTSTVTQKVTKANASQVFDEAFGAAQLAVAQTTPTPMVVGEAVDFFSNEVDYAKPTYVVAGGLCGRAGVVITPARGAFVTYLKANKLGYPNYGGGYYVPSYRVGGGRGQSYELALSAARAAAGVFASYGLDVYVQDSLD